MYNLKKLISQAKKENSVNDEQILNIIREYLQILILKAIYQSKYGKGLSFMGGTCLRICYDLRRYSEDLDFTLDRKIPKYSFLELNEIIASFLKNTDFEVDFKVSEDKIVQKSFIRVSKVLHLFGISPLKAQKLHVKLEIDTNPVKIKNTDIETFFVSKFNELFPILKFTEGTLFSGKIGATLNRGYSKGRDFYDIIWYLNRGTKINFKYLNDSFSQAGLKLKLQNNEEVLHALKKKVNAVNVNDIMKDVDRFLENPREREILKDYKKIFEQAAERFLTSA